MLTRHAAGGDAAPPDAPPPDAESHSDEAMNGLRLIYEAASAYYEDLAAMPDVTPQVPSGWSGVVPSQGTCCGNPGNQCEPGEIGTPPFDGIGLFDEPFYFSYSYDPTGWTSFTAAASADLDCDGVFSLFEAYGALGADGVLPPFEAAEKTSSTSSTDADDPT